MSLETATGRAASKPDLTFVILIHQSLRADAARLAATLCGSTPIITAAMELPLLLTRDRPWRARLIPGTGGARASFEPRHGEAPAGWHVVRKPSPAGWQADREPGQPGPLNATT